MKEKDYTWVGLVILLIAVAITLWACHDRGEANSVPELILYDIEIGLPTKMFVGTPPNLSNIPNLEKFDEDRRRPTFLAPEGCINVALNKSVRSTDEEPIIGEIELITDGDKEGVDGSFVELGPFVQHITIDLEQEYNIYGIIIWHYHRHAKVYYDVIVEVSSDPDFLEKTILFNNYNDNSSGQGIGDDMNYIEDYNGKLIDGKGARGRYVRCYSAGDQETGLNHYVEVEVYGK